MCAAPFFGRTGASGRSTRQERYARGDLCVYISNAYIYLDTVEDKRPICHNSAAIG